MELFLWLRCRLYGKRGPADVIKAPNPLILRQVDYLTQSLKLFKSRSGKVRGEGGHIWRIPCAFVVSKWKHEHENGFQELKTGCGWQPARKWGFQPYKGKELHSINSKNELRSGLSTEPPEKNSAWPTPQLWPCDAEQWTMPHCAGFLPHKIVS